MCRFVSSAVASCFKSTPPARGTTRLRAVSDPRLGEVSIHAPRAGDDAAIYHMRQMGMPNPRPPRGATHTPDCATSRRGFNPRPPRGGGDKRISVGTREPRGSFNPRPPRAGGDVPLSGGLQGRGLFNPRPPRGGRLNQAGLGPKVETVSIHAPRAGGDTPAIRRHFSLLCLTYLVSRARAQCPEQSTDGSR